MAKTQFNTPPVPTGIDATAADATATDTTPEVTTDTTVADTTVTDTVSTETAAIDSTEVPATDTVVTEQVTDTTAETPVVTDPVPVADTTAVVTPDPVVPQPLTAGETAPEKEELTLDEVSKIITDNKMSVTEKLEKILADGTLEFKTLVSKLISYNADMGSSTPMLPERVCAGRNYDLYNVLVNVVSTPVYQTFRVKFDLINMAFHHFATDAFHEIKLHRFDNFWSFGEERLKTHQALVTVIALLANKAERKGNLTKVNFKHAFSKDRTLLNDTAVANLIKYYTL